MKRVTKERVIEFVNAKIVEKKMLSIKSKTHKVKDIKSQFYSWLDDILIELEKADLLYDEDIENIMPDIKKKFSSIIRNNKKIKIDHETQIIDSYENSN